MWDLIQTIRRDLCFTFTPTDLFYNLCQAESSRQEIFAACGRKEACMPQWRFGLQPELFGSRKLAFSDPT